MSIVDCQNYPKKGEKVRICKNCRHFVAKEPVGKRYECSGFCASDKVTKAFEYGYRVDGVIHVPVMSNGNCENYEEW